MAKLLADPKATWRQLDCLDAKDSLLDYCGLIEIPGAPVDEDPDDDAVALQPIRQPPAAHHRLLISKLEDIEAGRIRRLMVFMPPGSAKSSYASVVFPTWFMGRKKRRNIIVATYGSDLARKIGRRARSILRQPIYSDIFGTSLSPDSSAADEWALTNENEFMGGGILSGITGNRAAGILIDDPVKGRQDADSPTVQQRTREEYQDSLKTRLVPGGWICLIQTRWNQGDLAGSILPEDYDGRSGPILCRDGEVWEVLCVPAQCDRADDPLGRKIGEYLWPEWFTEQHWAAFRSNARTWSALYQQRPQPDEGTYFQRDWFPRYFPNQKPANLHIYGTSDYAVTEDGGDWTVHRVWGLDPDGDLWMLDGWRGQTTADVWIERQIDLIEQHKPFAWFGEAGVIAKTVEPMLFRRLRERKASCRLEWLPSIADKPTRARGFQARAAMKRVHLPEGIDGDLVLDEYLHFPAGRHDDDVDCGSLIGRALDQVHPAIVKVKTNNPNPPDLGMFRRAPSAGSWKTK